MATLGAIAPPNQRAMEVFTALARHTMLAAFVACSMPLACLTIAHGVPWRQNMLNSISQRFEHNVAPDQSPSALIGSWQHSWRLIEGR